MGAIVDRDSKVAEDYLTVDLWTYRAGGKIRQAPSRFQPRVLLLRQQHEHRMILRPQPGDQRLHDRLGHRRAAGSRRIGRLPQVREDAAAGASGTARIVFDDEAELVGL